MIDFGLSTQMTKIEVKNLEKSYLLKGKKNKKYTKFLKKPLGNKLFMSLDVLKGSSPSKKTELESFIYLIIYLFKLKLPWQNVKSKTPDEKIEKIIKIHSIITEKELFKNIPYQFLFLYTEISKIKGNQKPNYNLYIRVIKDLVVLNEHEKEQNFCWENKLSQFFDKNKNNFINSALFNKYNKLFEGYPNTKHLNHKA